MIGWMIRAGTKGVLFDKFVDEGIASIGWRDLGAILPEDTVETLREKVAKQWPDWHPNRVIMSAGQLHRFAKVIQTNDYIVTYDPSQRIYKIGKSKGGYRFNDSFEHDDHGNIISVDWTLEVARDDLLPRTKNSLGAISTLFKIPDHAMRDLLDTSAGEPPVGKSVEPRDNENDTEDDIAFTLEAIETRAADIIADKLVRLSWEDMQEVVAGVLRGMGYKTDVSPKGPDRGKDIIASPDGLGFSDPRIIVEVKHRASTSMGASEIRAFLGGRQDGDKCLYVSTGGFTKEARYEAERSRYPLKLLTLSELTELILADYEALDAKTRELIPLTRIYWPN
ncbi:restriction endonuclease [Litorimonas cladophorae]|uniref:Restriction endonuclease n=1 Tax=Litorimonas cladophorae TaxID=1220491 RepID=A0A918KLF6_9PROT|nr:restriction endonuclease [Litorimonas cladophorae]GGX66955.1 restriction endonuclease [Litorimonas cladophorae]